MTQARWRVVYDTLRTKIVSGEMRPGDRVPTELDLARWFEYSRSTIRQALTQLASEGLVSTGGGSQGRRVLHRPDAEPPPPQEKPPWPAVPEPPDEPCLNPACTESVYWPDKRSFWASVWIPGQGRENPITKRACSIACLAAALLNPEHTDVDTRWGR